ncbi:MAG: hypothetical protein ACTS41_01145 [Candidatus Hodgkinia cicadicola]
MNVVLMNEVSKASTRAEDSRSGRFNGNSWTNASNVEAAEG